MEVELEKFSLTYFPKDKKVLVFSYGNIYQKETNFEIALILKELIPSNPEYFLIYINLKDIANFPIGTIVNNQKKLNKFVGSKANLILNLENIKSKMLFEIPNLRKEIITFTFPPKINKFNSKYHVQGQYYFILKDKNTNKNVYIPHYEVARWFYFTTPSMTKQILSASLKEESSVLKGLYKSINHIDSESKEIILTQNANTNDAPNIFRYATDMYSNNSWHQIRRNLTASAEEIRLTKKEKGYSTDSNEMKIKANFPIREEIILNARVKVLEDGSFLILKFINENSSYNFETLFIKIERKNKTDTPVGVIKNKKIDKDKLSKKITNNVAQEETLPIIINNKTEDFEERLDLNAKSIEKVVVYIDEKEFVQVKDNFNSDKNIDLSTKNPELYGDKYTASAYIENENKKDNNSKYLTLIDFKNMLFECAKKNEEFSFNIQIEDFLPQKPKDDKNNKRKWKKAKLNDYETQRRYLSVSVSYKKKNFILIEIERDSLVDGLSTLIIWDNDNSKISNEIVVSVVKNFVFENGRWLKNYEEFVYNKDFLEHPRDDSKKKEMEWCKKLIEILENKDRCLE